MKIEDKAPDFKLQGVDDRYYSLSDFKSKQAIVVIFTCNHCPYVQAYENRIIALQEEFKDKVQIIAINANDDVNFPEDSFENMKIRSMQQGFNFLYLRDETQEVARDYGAERTPEAFVFDKNLILKYRGRIDDNWKSPKDVKSHDLRDAIRAVLEGNTIKEPEKLAIGCTIKWRD